MKIDVEDYDIIRTSVTGMYATVEEVAQQYATSVEEVRAIVERRPLVRPLNALHYHALWVERTPA